MVENQNDYWKFSAAVEKLPESEEPLSVFAKEIQVPTFGGRGEIRQNQVMEFAGTSVCEFSGVESLGHGGSGDDGINF